ARRGMEIIRDRQVRRRKAELAAALVALRDAAFDLPIPAKQLRRRARPALRQMFANTARRGMLAAGVALRHEHGNAETELRGHVAQQRGIAGPALAEGEILADHDVPRAELRDQEAGDEILGGAGGEGAV